MKIPSTAKIIFRDATQTVFEMPKVDFDRLLVKYYTAAALKKQELCNLTEPKPKRTVRGRSAVARG